MQSTRRQTHGVAIAVAGAVETAVVADSAAAVVTAETILLSPFEQTRKPSPCSVHS
jgi:hypothetical protein